MSSKKEGENKMRILRGVSMAITYVIFVIGVFFSWTVVIWCLMSPIELSPFWALFCTSSQAFTLFAVVKFIIDIDNGFEEVMEETNRKFERLKKELEKLEGSYENEG